MSKIKELLVAQANAIKANAAKIKQAELLEKVAKELREEASPSIKVNYKKPKVNENKL